MDDEILIEAAAESFCDDVARLADQYRQEGEALTEQREEAIAAARKMEREAEREFWERTRMLNLRYKTLLGAAQEKRETEAKHPESISAAGNMLLSTIGGACSDIVTIWDESDARAMIQRAERKRARREKSEYSNT